MQIIHRLAPLRERLNLIRKDGKLVALVPTMGALHDGHMTLVAEAKRKADHVVVSIFVNPRQFGANEDLAAYPRPADADAALLSAAGVSLLWMPPVEAMYPTGYATTVSVSRLGNRLCGANRRGHFDGVATVVAKLFAQIRPEMALFGEKDWQQLAIIRRISADLDLGVDVIGVPTVREPDGLAMSSRNGYLSKAERKAAQALPMAMKEAAATIANGADIAQVRAGVSAQLIAAGFASVDYVTLAGADDLVSMSRLGRPARLFVAARIGRARLIDNWPVEPITK